MPDAKSTYKNPMSFEEIEEQTIERLTTMDEDTTIDFIENEVDSLSEYFIKKGFPYELAIVICQKFCLDSAKTDLQEVIGNKEDDEEATEEENADHRLV